MPKSREANIYKWLARYTPTKQRNPVEDRLSAALGYLCGASPRFKKDFVEYIFAGEISRGGARRARVSMHPRYSLNVGATGKANIPDLLITDDDGPVGWGALGVGVLVSYPFLMTVGTMGVGERYGARSGNRGEVYWCATLASLAGVGVSAAAGTIPGSDGPRIEEAVAGIIIGVIPNAFLNAYVYNRVKKPESGNSSSRVWAAPYVAAYRGGRENPIPVWGVTVCF